MVSSQVFEIVVKRHQGAIRRFLTSLTKGDTMLADDLAQETFIKAFYAWDSFAALSSPKTWLMRIAYNTFVDYTRSPSTSSESIQSSICNIQSSNGASGSSFDIRNDVQQAMLQLSEPERLCVQLALIEDRSIRQIVTITGLNENTVKSHLKRGKDKLRTFLINNGYDR
ncbi:MAG: sigma-70 family RNA polymerase sigma factor [Bacteroidales bacterium]|nr:sigma-70 family RNA polymerase sigma factor [Candidatus Colicola equi]